MQQTMKASNSAVCGHSTSSDYKPRSSYSFIRFLPHVFWRILSIILGIPSEKVRIIIHLLPGLPHAAAFILVFTEPLSYKKKLNA